MHRRPMIDEFRSQAWHLVILAFRPAKLDPEILSVDKSSFPKPLTKSSDSTRRFAR
jgi:hypothetical protein